MTSSRSELGWHGLQYIQNPLNSGHPAIPYNGRLFWSHSDASSSLASIVGGAWSTTTPELRTPRYKRTKILVPMVSALERFHCISLRVIICRVQLEPKLNKHFTTFFY